MSEQEMIARLLCEEMGDDFDAFGNYWTETPYASAARRILTTLEASRTPADESDALKLAKEYADKRDWNGAYCAMRVAYWNASASSDPVHRLALQLCNQTLRGEDGDPDVTLRMLDEALSPRGAE